MPVPFHDRSLSRAASLQRRHARAADALFVRQLGRGRQTAVYGQAKQSIVEERARSQLMPCLLRFWFTAVAKWVPVHPVGRECRPHRRGPASLDQRRDRPLLIVIGEQKVNRVALLATPFLDPALAVVRQPELPLRHRSTHPRRS